MLRIRSAKAIKDFWLELTLTDNTVIERDVQALLAGPVFEPLRRDPHRFRQVHVDHGSVQWAGDLDLDPDVLIWGGAPPGEVSARPAESLRLEMPATTRA